jgi:hypothetical protein
MAFDLTNRVVRREPLETAGKSGSRLERGWLDDGSVVVLKHSRADEDWIMEATGDTDRVALLWEEGIFGHIPSVVQHAVLDVRRTDTGTLVVMEDVSELLFSNVGQIRQEHHRILGALADMHRAFVALPLPPLCPLDRLYAFLSPQVCSRFAASHEVPRLAMEGWTRFHDIVPNDVSSVIEAIHARPADLGDALSLRESTLVHGDPKMANLGVTADRRRLVLLDWGSLSACGPPAIDFAWYLAINKAAIGRDHAQLLEDARTHLAPVDEVALRLALLGALVQLGWEKALGATADDPTIRRTESDDLTWWIDRAREAVESWPD